MLLIAPVMVQANFVASHAAPWKQTKGREYVQLQISAPFNAYKRFAVALRTLHLRYHEPSLSC
jgi:hypothetical protein